MVSLAPLVVMDVARMVPVPVIVPAGSGGRHGHPVVSLSEDDNVVDSRHSISVSEVVSALSFSLEFGLVHLHQFHSLLHQ